MATTSVTMTATCLNGKPLEALERLIDLRQGWLRETTSEAVIATAINVLSSIRAITKVADEKKALDSVSVTPFPSLVPSFRSVSKARNAKRVLCLRYGPHGHHAHVTFRNLAPPGASLMHYKVYVANDLRGNDAITYKREYYIIAASEEQARAYAAELRAKRIKRFKGMAKWTIGQAQSQVSQKGVAAEPVTSAARQIGIKELQVAVYEHGWGEGSVSVSVADTLRYAALALKGGPGEMNTALMRAANRTAGILNHSWQQKLFSYAPIPTPFPEVAGRKR